MKNKNNLKKTEDAAWYITRELIIPVVSYIFRGDKQAAVRLKKVLRKWVLLEVLAVLVLVAIWEGGQFLGELVTQLLFTNNQ